MIGKKILKISRHEHVAFVLAGSILTHKGAICLIIDPPIRKHLFKHVTYVTTQYGCPLPHLHRTINWNI